MPVNAGSKMKVRTCPQDRAFLDRRFKYRTGAFPMMTGITIVTRTPRRVAYSYSRFWPVVDRSKPEEMLKYRMKITGKIPTCEAPIATEF